MNNTYNNDAEDIGPHSLLAPLDVGMSQQLTKRALIVWNQLGRKNQFTHVYKFYQAFEKAESTLPLQAQKDLHKLDFDLINNEPPTSEYLRELFPNLYPENRDYKLPPELKRSTYINANAPSLQQAVSQQPITASNVQQNLNSHSIKANEEVFYVSQMLRNYCLTHKTTLKDLLLEFKAYSEQYGVNPTVSNVAFYMQYRTAIEERGIPFNGIINQNIPVTIPKVCNSVASQSIDIMKIFENAVKNINAYGNTGYYHNIMSAYAGSSNDNSAVYSNVGQNEVYNYNNMNSASTSGSNQAYNIMANGQPINPGPSNVSTDYSAMVKRNMVTSEQEIFNVNVNSTQNDTELKIPFHERANNFTNQDFQQVNYDSLMYQSTYDTIVNDCILTDDINNTNLLNSLNDDMCDVWKQLAEISLDVSLRINKSANSTKTENLNVSKESESSETNEKAKMKGKKLLKHSIQMNKENVLGNGVAKAKPPKQVTKEGKTNGKSHNDSFNSSFYLDAESNYSLIDSSFEEN